MRWSGLLGILQQSHCRVKTVWEVSGEGWRKTKHREAGRNKDKKNGILTKCMYELCTGIGVLACLTRVTGCPTSTNRGLSFVGVFSFSSSRCSAATGKDGIPLQVSLFDKAQNSDQLKVATPTAPSLTDCQVWKRQQRARQKKGWKERIREIAVLGVHRNVQCSTLETIRKCGRNDISHTPWRPCCQMHFSVLINIRIHQPASRKRGASQTHINAILCFLFMCGGALVTWHLVKKNLLM